MGSPPPTPLTYHVKPWLLAVMAAGTVAATVAALVVEGPGRFLVVVAAVGAAFECARAVVLRPTLQADADGVEVVIGLRRERHAWSAVTAVGTLEARGSRPRRRANALEIDLGDRLLIVAAYRLGASASDVADRLDELKAGGSGA